MSVDWTEETESEGHRQHSTAQQEEGATCKAGRRGHAPYSRARGGGAKRERAVEGRQIRADLLPGGQPHTHSGQWATGLWRGGAVAKQA